MIVKKFNFPILNLGKERQIILKQFNKCNMQHRFANKIVIINHSYLYY